MDREARLYNAISRGVDYLRQSQQADGQWLTYTSPTLELAEATAYPTSVYVTTFVIHALAALAPDPLIDPMLEQAATFISGEREPSGVWNYEGRGGRRVYPDFDDTSCAVAALQRLGQPPDLGFYAILWQNELAPGGPYFTWIGINQQPAAASVREVDALVNANIVFCCGCLNIELPGASAYLCALIEQADYQAKYCLSPHFLLYAVSRAYADGGVAGLKKAMPGLQTYILTKLAEPAAEPAAFNIACLAASLINTRATPEFIEPYLTVLLARQLADGSWPGWAAYRGFGGWYDGSPALTTAIALDALHKARQ